MALGLIREIKFPLNYIKIGCLFWGIGFVNATFVPFANWSVFSYAVYNL